MNVTTSFSNHSKKRRGFSLTELIAVMGIMGLLIAVSVPALSSLARAQGATSAAYQMKDFIEVARNYAMSNQTLVRIGIKEVNGSSTQSGNPALVVYAIRNSNPSEVGTVESLLDTSSVALDVQDGSGSYEYWDDLGRPLILEGVGFVDPSDPGLGTELSGQLGDMLDSNVLSLQSFTRSINGIDGNVTFDLSFVISRQGEFCLGEDLSLDLDGDGSADVRQHESYPARPFYFGLTDVLDEGGTAETIGNNVTAIGLNGLSGRVQIYRKGDTLPGGIAKL